MTLKGKGQGGAADVNPTQIRLAQTRRQTRRRQHGRGQGSRDLHHENGRRTSSNEGTAPRFTYRTSQRSMTFLISSSPTLRPP